MPASACGSVRMASVSSLRSNIAPPRSSAKRRFATAVSALPTCSDPVGLGANRTRTISPGTLRARPARWASVSPVEAALTAWYAESRRDLPWRRTRDPYAVLVSEVMLQQTQVTRVVPRYLAWLERWPTVEALADASRGDVIVAWQGLGYNRRAVNLHRAAQHVAAGGWPDDLTELPGVGRYTADALGAFAFGRPVLPVDTNVRRVLERTGGRFGPRSAQALFDLGATVCLARVPRCGACPLGRRCPSHGRRYEPARRQGPLAGSFRERRARLLRLVAEAPRDVAGVDGAALASLERDGLVRVRHGSASLP
jgi:A/G-specific adenine glycosylase